jgi:anti-anti-sigma regulatory factor
MLEVEKTGRLVIVRAPSRLVEWEECRELRQALHSCWLDPGVLQVLVDMGRTERLGVMGFAKLLLYHHRMQERRPAGELAVARLRPEVAELFRALLLDRVLAAR